jgi:hypothetical protein
MAGEPPTSSSCIGRIGRFLLLRDAEGRLVAVSANALLAAAATDDGGTVAVLAGGKALMFSEDVPTVVGWFA